MSCYIARRTLSIPFRLFQVNLTGGDLQSAVSDRQSHPPASDQLTYIGKLRAVRWNRLRSRGVPLGNFSRSNSPPSPTFVVTTLCGSASFILYGKPYYKYFSGKK